MIESLQNSSDEQEDSFHNVTNLGGTQFVSNTEVHNMTVNLDVLMIILVCLAMLVMIFYLLVKTGIIGPSRLTEEDLRALKTFNDSYRITQMELEEDVLGHQKETFWYLFERDVAITPVVDWNEMYPSALRGFLIELAKHIDEKMFLFQCRVWMDGCSFMSHLPVILVAQEWRRWAMETLQYNLSPKPEVKVALQRRLDWIENIRDLSLNGVWHLRSTKYWDDSDELSLLVVLRTDIARWLRKYVDNWEILELQQGFAQSAGEVVSYITQMLRNTIRFLEKVYTYDQLRLHQVTRDSQKWFAPIDEELLYFQDVVDIWHEDFPMSFRDHFGENQEEFDKWFAERAKHRPSDFYTVVKYPEAMTQIEKEKVQKYMGSYGHWRFGFSTEEELIRSLRSAVVLMEQCYILLDAALLMMSLQNFASLGGTNMFLAGQVSAEDATQVLDWIDKAVQEVRQHIVRIADIGQGGWSNLRRKKKTSWFSHPGPLDNMRLAMNIEDHIERLAMNESGTIRAMKAHLSNCRVQKGGFPEDELSKELKYFQRFWEAISKKHWIDEDDHQRPIRYI